jgi:glutamate/tyrosine decarboxylase-like PLP-dependent enzyme
VDWDKLMSTVAGHAAAYRADVANRFVGPHADIDQLRQAFGSAVPEAPTDAEMVIAELVRAAEDGLVAMTGPRYFGFVIGSSVPAAAAADMLTSAWDQNTFNYVMSPAGSVAEETVARWLLDLLRLPATASVGLVTGATMANFTGLAAARHHVLAGAGWDVEADGLYGGPEVHVVVGADRHASLDLALRYLGLGSRRVRVVPADDQGRMRADALLAVLAGCDGPTIVCAQAGNVGSGAVDPMAAICAAAHQRPGQPPAWVHVDGAFGLWAAASPALRHLCAGVDEADSWAVDAHKWLNVPYDTGIAIVRHPNDHVAATWQAAAYLLEAGHGERDGAWYTPESSRRARGFPVWAAIRELGRSGIVELIERCCGHARRFADTLGSAPGVEVLNDVVLNQVLVHFHDPSGGDSNAYTQAVIDRVQRDGTCWLGGTDWQGRAAMRISVSAWTTTEADVDRSAEAILWAAQAPGMAPA